MDSQYTGPDGNNYDSQCIPNSAEVLLPPRTTAHAWFNDPDGDCISDDWIAEFYHDNGTPPNIWTPYRWQTDGYQQSNGNPDYDFGGGFWDCCDYNTDTGGSDGSCECTWVFDDGGLTIDCPPCFAD